MGLVLASTFILYRYANALSNLLEYPVWLASGPALLDVAAAGLDAADLLGAAADWGVLAMRHAALGGAVWRRARDGRRCSGIAALGDRRPSRSASSRQPPARAPPSR